MRYIFNSVLGGEKLAILPIRCAALRQTML